MKIEKRKTLSSRDSDFASILDESPWEKLADRIKPLLKAVLILALVGGLIYGGTLLFGKHKTSSIVNGSASTVPDSNKDDIDLAKCVNDSISANPTPEAGDPQFYGKLISNYDKQISCYDKYPNADQSNRSRLDGLRQGAISARNGNSASISNTDDTDSPTVNSGRQSTTTATQSNFNPNACDSYKNEYDRLKGISDQLNDSIQKQDSPSQASIDELQKAFEKQNKAYSDFQKCKAESYQ